MSTYPLIKKRLIKETETNVSLRVEQSPDNSEEMVVFGRGELQLGILIENMRREGLFLKKE
jgi:GTP-binding protein